MSQDQTGDLLIVFSGSGNSPNLIKAIETAKSLDMRTAAILGFEEGRRKALVDLPIHFPIADKQISEDLQQVVGHMLTRFIKERIAAN